MARAKLTAPSPSLEPAVYAEFQKLYNYVLSLEQAWATSFQVTGDHTFLDAAKGVVLKDTQATPHYWRVTVDNAGALVTTDLGTVAP